MWVNSEFDNGWSSEDLADQANWILYDRKTFNLLINWFDREKFAQSLTNACGWTWEIWARDYALSSIEESLEV